VVLNLLRNEIEATQRKSTRGPIRVCVSRAQDGEVVLDISDRGAGVSEGIVPRLFEAFVSDKPGGMGLGLSISRSVIEAHGGAMRYAPNAGGGSVFGFRLPARDA
jgi:two-component system sensor kinase FixL